METDVSEKRPLDEFMNWKVEVLKLFLRQRGLKTSGKKVELAALAYGDEQLDVPLKLTSSEESRSKALSYKKLLSPRHGINLPNPFYDLEAGWISEVEGVKLWPAVMQIDLTRYLLTLDDRDIGKRILSDYKVSILITTI